MLARFKSGWLLIAESLKAFRAYPKLLAPLLATWAVYAPAVVYLRYYVPWDSMPVIDVLLVVAATVLAFSALLSFACLVLLELVEQIETGHGCRVTAAVGEAVRNSGRALPVMLLWAALWFVITVIEMLLPRASEDDDSGASAQGVAETVAGFDDFSLSRAFLEALSKGVRMLAFLIYPAIAWENQRASAAIKKGLGIARAHQAEFASGFVLSEAAATIVFLPPSILFILSDDFSVHFSDTVWMVVIVYCAFAWSFSVMLEQLFTAQLYLWHLMWEQRCLDATAAGVALPDIGQIRPPSLVDGVNDLSRVCEESAPG